MRGLRTLPLRMEVHSKNALEVARYLEFRRVIERLRVCKIGLSWGSHGGILAVRVSRLSPLKFHD
ncbi:PLP-dependent transferase [Paenibacillus agricola]|uniref:Uncharacterized protein n=1 Tax=Paenibacillus agricola TaxID=2716264 RepID=A0ABX0J9P5_9BACL|nr:hypothetical protein [Paenibacillus agricola]